MKETMAQWLDQCKEYIVENNMGKMQVEKEDIFVVWSCKTLQNKKALLSFGAKGAPYYECTYDGNMERTYIDKYEKASHQILYDSERISVD